jgi:hypothetical protein
MFVHGGQESVSGNGGWGGCLVEFKKSSLTSFKLLRKKCIGVREVRLGTAVFF